MFTGKCVLLLTEADAFESVETAFAAYNSGDQSKIIESREKHNLVTDLGWRGFFGSHFSSTTTIETPNYIVLCNATYNPDFDYRRTGTFSSAGITTIYASGSSTPSLDMAARKKVLTSTFSAPTSTRTINCICTQFSNTTVSTSNYPFSILFLDSPITQTPTTSLYCLYTFTWQFTYDETGNYPYSSRAFIDLLNHQSKYGSYPHSSLYNRNKHYKYLTPKRAPIDMNNVCEGCYYGLIPNTYSFGNPAATSTYRHTYSSASLGVSTGTALGSDWVFGRGILSEYNDAGTLTLNNYPRSSMIIGYNELSNQFVSTPVIKHGTTDTANNTMMVNPTLTPPPSSVATVDIIPDPNPTNTDVFTGLSMCIARSGDASYISTCGITEFNPTDSTLTLDIPGGYTFDVALTSNLPSVVLSTDGTLPTELSAATTYYALAVSGNVIKLSLTDSGDSIVEFTDSGSGTATLERTATATAYITKQSSEGIALAQFYPINPLIDGTAHHGRSPDRFMQMFPGYYRYGDNVYILYNNSYTADPAMYLLRWRFNTVEHAECVMKLPDNYIFTAAVVNNSLWCAGKTGLYVINLDTLTQTEVLTAADGLLEDQCVHIEKSDGLFYIFHRNSVTVLDKDKNVVRTITNAMLNPTDPYDFHVSTIQIMYGCIVWGDIKPTNRNSGGGTISSGIIKVFNTNTNVVTVLTGNRFYGQYNDGYYTAPSAVYVEKIDDTKFKLVIVMANSGDIYSWYYYMGFIAYSFDSASDTYSILGSQMSSTATQISSDGSGTHCRMLSNLTVINRPNGDHLLRACVMSNHVSAESYYSMMYINLQDYTCTYDTKVNFSSSLTSCAALQIDSANVHYKFSAGFGSYTHRFVSADSGDFSFMNNGYNYISSIPTFWDDTTNKWSLHRTACKVKPVMNLTHGEQIVVNNTAPATYSPTSQLVAGELMNKVYGHGFIKMNSQSATISSIPSVYFATMNLGSVSFTIASDLKYTVPESTNINFRQLVDDESVVYLNGVELTRVTATTPIGYEYRVYTTGYIAFGPSLLGATVDIEYTVLSRN